MKKILFIICLLFQNTSLFATQTDTLAIHENEKKLLSNKYFLELPEPASGYKIEDVIRSKSFHVVNSTLPLITDNKPVIWLKFILRNSTTRAFVPIKIGASVIDNFDLYFTDGPNNHIIHLSSSVPYRETKLIKQNNTFINAIIFPDSTRIFYLRIKSNASEVIPVEVNSANTFFKNADFENMLVGAFIGIVIIMALYNLVLYFIIGDKSYLYYVAYIITLGITQVLVRGYGVSFFVGEQAILNNFLIPLARILFGYSVLFFAAQFLQLRNNLKGYFKFYYLLFLLYSLALVSIGLGWVNFAYNLITFSAGLMAVTLLVLGSGLYIKGFKPAKYFMIGWGLFFITMLVSIARNRGLIVHTDFTQNIIIYSSVLQLILFSVSLAEKINFYRRQSVETQLLSLTIARENERLITEQNLLLETEVNARTQQLIETNADLSKTIENLKSTQIKLVETEKMASLGQLTAGIAHEINNPINFVGSNVKPLRLDFLELFNLIDRYREAGLAPDKKELLAAADQYRNQIDLEFLKTEILSLLDGIEEGASRTTEIVQSLRSFSRTDELVLKPADVNKAILNTLILLRSTIPYNIEIKPVLNKLPLLNCYPGKINQVLMNLINNSIQAIKSKSMNQQESITIITNDQPENITIEIIDTGIGISSDIRKRIFEPFFTTKNVGEGTGLGLSIVFGIIEDHQGSIVVNSEPDKGSSFTITLPKDLR